MPAITLSESTFGKLQALAQPFVDTPESVIGALADAEIARRSDRPNGHFRENPSRSEALHLHPDAHESLTHARLLSATVNGDALHRPKWNSLREHMHILALKRLGSFDALRRVTSANLRQGRYEEDGYKYVPEIDLSIQGVDADLAWDHSLRLARTLRVAIEVKFEWRDKEGAAHPGKMGILKWEPKAE